MQSDKIHFISFFILVLPFFHLNLLGQIRISSESMENAAKYSENTGGSVVMILQNDQIVFENYHNGADETLVTHIFSATKGFWAVAAAVAREEGLISSYEERVANTITEWQNSTLHPGKNLIKVKHLLALSSGLSQDIDQIQGLDAPAENIYQYTVDSLDLNFLPGSKFQYGPSNYYAFAVYLEKKLQEVGIHQNPLEYLDSLVFQPIGLEYDSWAHDETGNPHLPNGCFINPREWMKFGKLLLQKGSWNGIQIIDSLLIDELFTSDGPNIGHGKFLWLNDMGGQGDFPAQVAPPGSLGGFIYHDGYLDIIGALGAGKNRMYIIPSLKMVVLRQTLNEDDGFDDHTFLSFLLSETISSTEEVRPKNVSIYPNPVSDELIIKNMPGNKNGAIINMNGLVLQTFNQINDSVINVSSLPKGIYFLKVFKEKNVGMVRFIKN